MRVILFGFSEKLTLAGPKRKMIILKKLLGVLMEYKGRVESRSRTGEK